MARNKGYHVVPHNDAWALRRENASHVSSTSGTQRDGIAAGDLPLKPRPRLVRQPQSHRVTDAFRKSRKSAWV